jgi:diguanylate cyclase
MPSLATEEQWKDRYRDLVRELEDKERAWKARETALRSTAGKLALAAMGQSPELDAAVDHVLATLRTDGPTGTLDSGLSGLVRALQLHDGPGGGSVTLPALPAASVIPGAQRREVLPLLRRLIRDLSTVGALADAARSLERRLDAGVPNEGWEPFLHSVADAVADVVMDLQGQRRELEEFLEQVTRQLAEFEGWTGWQAGAAQHRIDESAGLERSVTAEMRGLTSEVEASPDFVTLKIKVQARLNTVAGQLRDFREREEQRHVESERRTQELRKEVVKLKSRTDDLINLCAEQEARLMTDSLTGVHSRYAYERRISEEFQRWQRHAQPLAFAMWDIDLFKQINDGYGHDAGDRLLRGVAELLGRHKRAEDFLARIGGEEFVLLSPMTTAAAGLAMADKIRQLIGSAPFRHHGEPVSVTISCGLTEFRSGDTPASVYERADRALYQAKTGGRNRCVAI